MMIIINLSVYCGFRCLYKYDKKFTKSSIGHIHSLMLAKWRHRETFSKKNEKWDRKRNHLQWYEKEYWRLTGRLMNEESRKTSKTFFLTKRGMCYNKRSACKKRWHKKKNGKNRNYTIYYRGRRFWSSTKECPEVDSCSEERNPVLTILNTEV